MIKRYFSFFFVFIIFLPVLFILFSCPPPEEDGNGDDHGFIDQTLQGKIGGVDWEFVSGTAEDYGDEMWINLYDIEPAGGNPWAFDAYFDAEDQVFFTIESEEGLYELDWEHTVTLWDDSEGMNVICIEGAVEIISIDVENDELTGRLNARSDSDNYVNGNFTCAYQPATRR